MKKMYTITEIVHSGRKGVRGEPVTEPKYNDLIGSDVYIDFDTVKQYSSAHFVFDYHPDYDYWDTSDVLGLATDHNGHYELETANAIYKFDENRRD